MLVEFLGPPGVGKSTLIKLVEERLNDSSLKVKLIKNKRIYDNHSITYKSNYIYTFFLWLISILCLIKIFLKNPYYTSLIFLESFNKKLSLLESINWFITNSQYDLNIFTVRNKLIKKYTDEDICFMLDGSIYSLLVNLNKISKNKINFAEKFIRRNHKDNFKQLIIMLIADKNIIKERIYKRERLREIKLFSNRSYFDDSYREYKKLFKFIKNFPNKNNTQNISSIIINTGVLSPSDCSKAIFETIIKFRSKKNNYDLYN